MAPCSALLFHPEVAVSLFEGAGNPDDFGDELEC